MIQLRYYQQEAIDALFSFFEQNRTGNPLVALPTGAGKSVVIAGFLARVYELYAGQKTMMLTHRKELIAQNFRALSRVWPMAPAGVYSAGLNARDHTKPITFAGIQSVWNKSELFGHVDLIIVDEAHLVSPKAGTMYRKFITDLRKINPKLRVIGLSATIYRSDTGYLVDAKDAIFTHVCYDRTQRDAFCQLVDDGFLAPLETKRTIAEIKTDGVKMRGGDFVESELAKRVLSDTKGLEDSVREIIAEGQSRKAWLVFTVNIEHAAHIAAQLSAGGVPCAVYHSEQASADNDRALAAFKKGELRALVNVNCLTTGLDVPQIDMIAILRPTRSVVLWVQMLGRGTRTAKGKTDCKVLDFGHCAEVLGPINDPNIPRGRGEQVEDCASCPTWRTFREPDGRLTHDACPTCGKPFLVVLRACPVCAYYDYAGCTVCKKCGFEFPREPDIKDAAATVPLMVSKRREEPIITLDVERITYALHRKEGGDRFSLKVTYCHGLQEVSRYVLFEHEPGTYPRQKAFQFWERHTRGTELANTNAPTSAQTAYLLASKLREPVAIRIQRQGKYFEILEEIFGAHNHHLTQESTAHESPAP